MLTQAAILALIWPLAIGNGIPPFTDFGPLSSLLIICSDGLGLFPIAYMARLDYFHLGQDSPDWKIAVATAQQYIDAWPYHLPDGTLSRMSGWPGEPTGKPTFVWADDSFMGA